MLRVEVSSLTVSQVTVQPSLDAIRSTLSSAISEPNPPNLVPICTSLSSEFLTPSSIYLKVAAKLVSHCVGTWGKSPDTMEQIEIQALVLI
jgi:anthranilate synthase component 1